MLVPLEARPWPSADAALVEKMDQALQLVARNGLVPGPGVDDGGAAGKVSDSEPCICAAHLGVVRQGQPVDRERRGAALEDEGARLSGAARDGAGAVPGDVRGVVDIDARGQP